MRLRRTRQDSVADTQSQAQPLSKRAGSRERSGSLLLGQERLAQLVRYFFTYGPGGPLFLLWTIGMGFFLLASARPIYALIWTVVVVTLGYLMFRSNRVNPEIQERLLHSAVGELYPPETLSDPSLRTMIQKGAEVFVELALKVFYLRTSAHDADDFDRTLTAAFELLSLQYELAGNSEELVHGLAFISTDAPVGADLITEAPTNRGGVVEAVHEEARRSRILAGDIGQQLETLMLRVLPIQRNSNAIGPIAEIAQEMETILARAHDKINSTRRSPAALADNHTPRDLRPLLNSLQLGFSRNRSAQGTKSLQQLVSEFTEFQLILEQQRDTGSLSIARISALADETFRQGLGVLNNALDLLRSINSRGRERLEAESAELEREIEALKGDHDQETRLGIRLEKLASHRERLRLMNQQQSHVEILLHQCGLCEGSLHQTRIQLAELIADSAEVSINAVTLTLQNSIDQAKDVQAEMKRLGY